MTGPSIISRVVLLAVALSTAVVIVALAIVPFLNPVWVGFEQDRAGVTALTGYAEADVRTVTNSILHDLVIGPPAFNVAVSGSEVLTAAERAHMRDVRGVFAGFFLAAAAALVLVVAAFALARWRGSPGTRRDAWRAVRSGGLGLAAGALIAALVALVAFDAAFEVFHRLFFAQGTYLFDPTTSRLVQLFPDQFWSDTALAVGVVIVLLALASAWLAGQRLRLTGGEVAVPPIPTRDPLGTTQRPPAAREGRAR